MKNKNWRAVTSVMALFAAIFVFVTADAHAQGATAASLDKVTVSTDVAKRTLTKMQINAETARAIVDACVQFGKASNASYSIFVLAPNGDVIGCSRDGWSIADRRRDRLTQGENRAVRADAVKRRGATLQHR